MEVYPIEGTDARGRRDMYGVPCHGLSPEYNYLPYITFPSPHPSRADKKIQAVRFLSLLTTLTLCSELPTYSVNMRSTTLYFAFAMMLQLAFTAPAPGSDVAKPNLDNLYMMWTKGTDDEPESQK